jgi:hypothetical protein
LSINELNDLKFIINITNDNFLYQPCIYYKRQIPISDESTTVDSFMDNLFPPIQTSIIPKDNELFNCFKHENIDQFKQLIFERPINIFKEGKYVLWDKIEINDVHQGQLDISYFLNALCAIAEFPERFDKIFVNKLASKNGCYAVNLFVQGKPKIITIDDYFPCHGNKTFAFSYSGPGEIWVQILEKAWAKINHSYAYTIGGLPSEALSALTCAPVFTYRHHKFNDLDKLWELLKENDDSGFIICSNSLNSSETEAVGLFPSQSYTVVSVKEYKNTRLLKMMNPWGAYEWKGDFCEGSSMWTTRLKKEMGEVNSNEGMFFIKFEDFLKYFEVTYVCKYHSDYYYDCKKFIQNPVESMVCAKFNITKQCRIVLGMHQKQKRFYRKVHNYISQFGRIILARYRNDSYEYVGSSFSDEEKILLEIDKLGKGEYHIFCHLNWPFTEDYCSYVLSIYSDVNVQIEELDEVREDYFEKIMSDLLNENIEKNDVINLGNLEVISSIDDNKTGYYFMLIKNMNENEFIKFTSEISYDKNKIKLISKQNLTEINEPNQENGLKSEIKEIMTTMIPPNSFDLVVFKMMDYFENCSLKINNYAYNLIKLEEPKKNQLEEIILKNMRKIEKTQLGSKLEYFEISNEEYIFLVFLNNSDYQYVVRFTFKILENLEIENKQNKIFLEVNSFDYIKLKKGPNFRYKNDFLMNISAKIV